MAHDVFISYASSDKAVADAVCSQLESVHRIRCWIAPRDITPGASWAESIIDALDSSKIMVLIFSNNANASMQIEREVERAVHKGINIIPLRIENITPTKTLEYFISAPHWLDALTVPLEQHIEKLAASVKALLARSQGPRMPAAAVPEAAEPRHATLPPSAPTPHTRALPKAEEKTGRLGLAAAAVLAVVAIGIGASWYASARPAPAVTTVPPPSPAPVPELPRPVAGAPAPAAGLVAPEPAKPSAVPVARAAAAAPAAAVATNPNLYIDFRNPLDEGSIAVTIDGQKRWSAALGPEPARAGAKPAKPRESFLEGLTLPEGTHKISVVLLHADGKTRDSYALELPIDNGPPRTLQIRLSRFKRNLQVAAVRAKPEAKP